MYILLLHIGSKLLPIAWIEGGHNGQFQADSLNLYAIEVYSIAKADFKIDTYQMLVTSCYKNFLGYDLPSNKSDHLHYIGTHP